MSDYLSRISSSLANLISPKAGGFPEATPTFRKIDIGDAVKPEVRLRSKVATRRKLLSGCTTSIVRSAKASLQTCLVILFRSSMVVASARAESPMQSTSAIEAMLRIPTSRLQNHSQEQLLVDLRRGIGPDDAAAIALYSNPALRAIRDRRGLAAAQLIQAGILPNPLVSYARDFVTGGDTG